MSDRVAVTGLTVDACHGVLAHEKVRPQPLQIASPWLVEQIAMHGASGVVAYQASQASRAFAGSASSSHSLSW